MPGATSTRTNSNEMIRMEPLGKTSSSRIPGQNGNATTEMTGISGDSNTGLHKRNIYEHNGVAVCSQKRALCIATIVFAILFAVSLIIAFAGPQNDCPCVGEKPANLEVENDGDSNKPLATNGEIFPWNNVRLPTFAHPTRYNITIHPNLTTLEVKGQVTIEFYVDRETNFIVFHSKNLTINEKMVQDRKGHRLKIAKLLEYPKHQQLYLELEESKFRRRGNYTVHLRFVSKLSSELEGFYLSSYITAEGEKRYLATTHFEPTYARSAFPCFDEPLFKAKFKMSIFRDRFHIALCNMPVVNTEDAGFYMGTGLLRDDFQESVDMSTYLVAYIICDYKRVSEMTERNVSVSVYAAETMLPQAKYAVTTAAHIMDYFESFFGIRYPLPKQDLIAIPDFAAGAMENWGLITYRETSILYDPVETSTAAHQWVAIVVAHELAHQWFGNLVTMKWWNDLWLNEGVASFLEHKGVDHVSPKWGMMDQFILDKTQPALHLDALASSHPISVPVKDPSEIEAIFDTISYNKGASILYMLEGFLCEDVMRKGLNDYLNSHTYGNADTNDLWAVFTKHTNHSFDVKAVMDTWTQQMGFPLITISRQGNVITATQRRFLLSSSSNDTDLLRPKSAFGYKWYVPLSYYTDKEPRKPRTVWMNLTDVTFEIPADVEFIKVNVNQSGFYRVTYSEEMWTSIVTSLHNNHSKFSSADRANLIDDSFSLCKAGVLNATVPLELSLYLLNERDFVPWATALDHFQSWSKKLGESSAFKRYITFVKRLLGPVTKYVGWTDDGTHLKKLLRSEVLQLAVMVNIDDVVKQAKSLFDDWMSKDKRIPPNFREVVYSAGIKYGGEKEWNHCWKMYQKTQVPSERRILLKALGAADDPWLLQRYLLASLDRNKIRPQDMETVLAVVADNPEGQLLAWRHLKAYWPKLQAIFGNGTFTMGGLISVVSSHFSTEYDYQEVSEYFRKVDVGSGQRALEQSLETIMLNIHWVDQNVETIDQWLVNYLNMHDMDLIEVLWKQDVDLGFTLVEPGTPSPTTTTKVSDSDKDSEEDDIEKLKALEAINATNDKEDVKDDEENKEEDPWAGLPYTIDLETGEYILIPSGQSESEDGAVDSVGKRRLEEESSLELDNHTLAGLGENPLGLNDSLGLGNDFTSDLLGGGLLGGGGVEGLLSNDSLGLPDGFNLEEALQLVGLDEAQPEEAESEVKKKTKGADDSETSESGKCEASPSSSSETSVVSKSSSSEDSETSVMIHTPQFHHPHHPHHRSFQGRMPFVRAMSVEQRWQDLASLLSLPGAPDHFAHPGHPGYPGHGISHSHYEAQRNVLLHNATLAPPVGDLNSTGPYHSVGGPSNLGSAVATSMNLTNSSEPMGTESNAAYKSEPTDMMYYHAPASDSINQTTDGFLSSLLNDEDLHLMDMAMNDGMYTMRMLDNSSNNASGPTGAAALPGVQSTGSSTTVNTAGVTTLPGVTDERMDASSDSAVSSMGSERVPSLSDGEWMETGSNSSHTQADSHYSMDYASKYRMPYDCSYIVSGRNGGSPRCQAERTMPAVAQKKHQMFAKRYFQEQGTGSPLGASAHPTTPIKYEYDTQTVGAGAPGNAYSGPIEGAAGPQPEMKYSCSVDFSRHQTGRSAIEHVHHNHTYHLPAESSGSLQRPLSRDKKVRKSEAEEHLTRDEKRARALSVPIAVSDIINLPMDEFNERLSKYDLSEAQLSLIRDIRRRGKNKVAAQNCRKRKLDQIISLADQVKEMRDRKIRLIRERDFMLLERQRVKDKFSQLYRHVFQYLRDPDGNQYRQYEYTLQQTADGNVLLVPRNQTNPHHPRPSSMEPKTKPDSEHKE